MHIRLNIFILIVCAIFSGCTVKTPLVERLEHKANSTDYMSWDGNGIVYALPKIGFDVQMKVSRTELEKPVCDAKKLTKEDLADMGIKIAEIKMKKRTIFALHSATLTSHAVPDPERVFIARFPESSGYADSSLQVKMGSEGTVNGVEASAASKAAPIAAKTIEFVGTVGAAVVAAGAKSAEEQKKECEQAPEDFKNLKKELSKYRALPTPFPKGTLDLYMNEIKAEQARIQALFIGKPTVLEGTVSCFVAPAKKKTKTTILNLYNEKGIEPKDAECVMDAKFLVPQDFKPKPKDKKSSISLNITLIDNTMLSANKAAKSEVPKSAGFFYSVPVRALVSLSGHEKANTKPVPYLLPQLGEVRALPQAEGSSPAMIVELDPETGALKSVKVSNSAADIAGIIGSGSTSTSGLLTAIATQRDKEREAAKEEAAKHEPLAVLTREQGMLEAELAIATAKEALRQLAQKTH